MAKPVELVCIALVIAHAAYLAASYWNGIWIVGLDGKGSPSDFVNVWAAGKLALQRQAPLAYDWPAHKAVEAAAVGYDFAGYFGWHYPPMFLFAAAALALIPYGAAYALWLALTFPLYVAAIRAIIGTRDALLLAAAFPAVLANFVVGQNGFLTAALMGGFLFFVERRPVLSGICLGLLTYKPHFGLIIPFVLAASGHWRVIISAGIAACAIAALSAGVFGVETWLAFFGTISKTSQAFLSDGWADFGKLQTVFGLTRTLGGGETWAWTLQGIVAATVALTVALVWRSNARHEIKAAALVLGAMLATPYLYTYDLVVLAVPLAFLIALGRREGFRSHEMAGICAACTLILIVPFVTAPVGFAAILVVGALIARRARAP
ncbi:MAG: DUF2029 domain-containing protein [Pseudolabrys sp.]|nr:DUF2029 domain-containing protein [Pseudolabrys sp.]